MKRPIYLDSHATTPVDPRVLETMLPFFTERFGNASSRTHAFGQDAAAAVRTAREDVASLLGASAREIVFTSGATESNNIAIKGLAHARRDRGRRIVTTEIEHDSVLDVCGALEREGFEIVRLPVSREGLLSLDVLERAVDRSTLLVSVMAANNEIGVLQPLADAARIAHASGAVFHSDIAQAAGKIPLALGNWGVDLASVSAHKLYGPKGAGALYIRRQRPRLEIQPIVEGGGHEGGLRSGTLNVPGIVGLGRACAIARDEMASEGARLGGAARSAARRPDVAHRGRLDQWVDVGAAAPQPERQLRGHRRGRSDARARRSRGISWRGLRVGDRRPLTRAARHRRSRGARPGDDPLRPQPVHDGRGG